MTRVLLTGAGGFLGAHIFEHLLAATEWDVIATDSFRHKGRFGRLARIIDEAPRGQKGNWRSRSTVITHDLAAPFTRAQAARLDADLVIAAASQSHVDRSIADPVPFIRNNTEVILSTLELCRRVSPQMVIVISTDEVYGPVSPGQAHAEWSPILPSNPYSASKAAQEAIAVSYWRTYGVPVVLVNCMNLFGEMQDPEKFIPMTISRLLAGRTVKIHGRPGDVGSRHWLHARNLADALRWLYQNRTVAMFPHADRPDRYNIAHPAAVTNLELARMIAAVMDTELDFELVDFHAARPGHDPHYGLDPAKITALGWSPPVPFRESLARTVRWTLKHAEWLDDDDDL